MSYANIMAKSCGEEEEEGGDEEEGEPPSLQEQEIEKMKLLFNQVHKPWSFLVEGVVSCCVNDKSKQNKQHKHGIIPYIFDCWADPVVHLLWVNITLSNKSCNLKLT